MSAHNGHISEDDMRKLGHLEPEQVEGDTWRETFGHQIHLGKEATPWERLGPSQVQSLLAFVVSPSVERAMEHAEIEGRVEDRVIRRKHGILE